MHVKREPAQSQLFTMRIWREDLVDGRFEIRGQVKHIPSAETIYFREWTTLQAFLTRKLQSKDAVDA
jgi:hypothetical protein